VGEDRYSSSWDSWTGPGTWEVWAGAGDELRVWGADAARRAAPGPPPGLGDCAAVRQRLNWTAASRPARLAAALGRVAGRLARLRWAGLAAAAVRNASRSEAARRRGEAAAGAGGGGVRLMLRRATAAAAARRAGAAGSARAAAGCDLAVAAGGAGELPAGVRAQVRRLERARTELAEAVRVRARS
jgi:hypothetical protein